MKIFKFSDVIPELYNIFFRRQFKFQFELIPYESKGLSLKKIGNFFLAGLNQFMLPRKPLGYPVIAQIEPTNVCNLKCPLCYTASNTDSRPRTMLSFETFKNVIDEIGDYLLIIILWNWGEPFLNPDIFRMISYAKSKNIIVHTSTNGNVMFDDEKAKKLIDSGLDSLIVAVDGATQKTYRKYRKGGNLDLVFSNIKTIVDTKMIKGSLTPRLNLRFVVMKHNEHELPVVRKRAEELGVEFFTVKAVGRLPSVGESIDSIFVPENPQYRRYEYETGTYERKQKPFSCMRPWKRITIDALGEITFCEFEYKNVYTFGNMTSGKSVHSIWRGKKAKDIRKKFQLGNNDLYLCRNCTYKNSVLDDCTIEKISLKQSGRVT